MERITLILNLVKDGKITNEEAKILLEPEFKENPHIVRDYSKPTHTLSTNVPTNPYTIIGQY